MNTTQIDDRIDRIALAYVTAHYDVSQMETSEFFEKFKKAHDEISEIYSYGNQVLEKVFSYLFQQLLSRIYW